MPICAAILDTRHATAWDSCRVRARSGGRCSPVGGSRPSARNPIMEAVLVEDARRKHRGVHLFASCIGQCCESVRRTIDRPRRWRSSLHSYGSSYHSVSIIIVLSYNQSANVRINVTHIIVNCLVLDDYG